MKIENWMFTWILILTGLCFWNTMVTDDMRSYQINQEAINQKIQTRFAFDEQILPRLNHRAYNKAIREIKRQPIIIGNGGDYVK